MPNGHSVVSVESILEQLFGTRLIGCGGAKQEAREQCLAAGRSETQCEEEAQRAWDNCMALKDALQRIAWQLRGVALKQTLVDEQRTQELWSKIFDDPKKAMVFSKHMAMAFKEAEIKLKDDETFSCLVFAGKKPKYLSSIVPPASGNSGVRLFQVFEPKIMKAVMSAVEKDKLR